MSASSNFIEAVRAGDVSAVRKLLGEDPSLASAKDATGVSAVMHALYAHQREIADLLIAAKTEGELDIFEASAAGRLGRISEILDRDADAATKWSADGFTPLHFAAFFDHEDVARALIRRGADSSAASRNSMNVTPLHSAAAAHGGAIVRLLLEQHVNPNARQQGGWTALHAAAQNGDAAMVRDLLEYGADPLERNDDGKTAADLATTKGHGEILKLLAAS